MLIIHLLFSKKVKWFSVVPSNTHKVIYVDGADLNQSLSFKRAHNADFMLAVWVWRARHWTHTSLSLSPLCVVQIDQCAVVKDAAREEKFSMLKTIHELAEQVFIIVPLHTNSEVPFNRTQLMPKDGQLWLQKKVKKIEKATPNHISEMSAFR